MNDKIPKSCHMCYERESRNLKSTRQQFIERYKDTENFDYTKKFVRLELRSSNLCNFKCRMCDASSSSEIQKEDEKYPLLQTYRESNSIKFDIEDNIDELKWFVDNYPELKHLCFTGGEPMLIKQYYQLMDYIIEKDLHENITLDLFTNCSVYNPLFIDKMLKFKKVILCMSIDGVGKTAEYQRHGTKWDVVEKNILRFVTMPKDIMFNTSISPYVLLDVSSLAKFLMRLYEINNNLGARCYSVFVPPVLHFENMNHDLRNIAYEEIDKAVEILSPDNFNIFKKELIGIKSRLQTTEPNNPRQFAQYTHLLDKVRDESFEEVFGYKLY
jgi:sulfatase maturation enzyme AslB (radical SAM superfamily)